jgi:hypothetical protein
MDPRAVDQAKQKLRKADMAFHALTSAQNYAAVEEAWTDFLLSAASVYSKLRQGAKGNGKSEAWFGRKIKDRKDDPLMRYLHYARNSEEHGIERVVARGPGGKPFSEGPPLKFGERRSIKMQMLDATKNPQTITLVNAIETGPCIFLVRVRDTRFNDHCDPPGAHLGKPIGGDGIFPDYVAWLGLCYLAGLIDEAEALVPASKAIAK